MTSTRWIKTTALSDTEVAETEVTVPNHRTSFTIDRAVAERLLFEAGYRPDPNPPSEDT